MIIFEQTLWTAVPSVGTGSLDRASTGPSRALSTSRYVVALQDRRISGGLIAWTLWEKSMQPKPSLLSLSRLSQPWRELNRFPIRTAEKTYGCNLRRLYANIGDQQKKRLGPVGVSTREHDA